ncbi:MAG: hypothetical protein U0X93_12060 [Anaerolineales bacterium]
MITVNGLALGAILPPADGNASPDITKNIPMKRWAKENEVEQALLFLPLPHLHHRRDHPRGWRQAFGVIINGG